MLPYCFQANRKGRKKNKTPQKVTGYAGHSILQGSIQQNNAVINYNDLTNKKEQVF